MERKQAFRFQLKPKGHQDRQMKRFAGACRYVFNRALAMQKERYVHGEKKLGYGELCRLLTQWRHDPETAWLAEAPIHPLQQSLKNLDRAYQNFFAGRADPPRFKKKGKHDSFRYPDPKQIRLDQANSRIFLPKLGWIRYRKSRDVLGEIRNVTISRYCDRWFVSIQTKREVQTPVHPSTSSVGIDMGVVRFATLSDGTVIEPLNSFRRHETALRKAQQSLSRKKKFSNNWKKAKARVQKIHARIANARLDFLHKTTHMISKTHAIVFVEDLQVRNMSRSGGNVKSRLNKAILDQGWFEFRRQLAYKLAWCGGRLITVPPHNTSRTCPECGYAAAENRPSQARFCCVQCGYETHADLVAALNIRRAGHARMACGSNGNGRRKQEPTEVVRAIA